MDSAGPPVRTMIFAGFDLEPFAAADQFDGVLLGAENLGEPAAQIGFLMAAVLVLGDDLVLAPFERVIELRHDETSGEMNLLERSAFSVASGRCTAPA